MLYISNSGNIKGLIPEIQNTQESMENSLLLGFMCKLDVILVNDTLFLYSPPCHKKLYQRHTPVKSDQIIYEAMNTETFNYLNNLGIHVLIMDHTIDKAVSSHGWLWSRKPMTTNQKYILYMPEHTVPDIKSLVHKPFGICSNMIYYYRE